MRSSTFFSLVSVTAPVIVAVAFMGCVADVGNGSGETEATEEGLTIADAGPGLGVAVVPCTSLVVLRGSLTKTTSTACGSSGALAKSDDVVVAWRGSDPPGSAVMVYRSPFASANVTKLEVLVRFIGDDRTEPLWYFHAKNKNTGVYDLIGDNSWAGNWVSTFHTFVLPNPANYVDAEGKVRVRVRSNDNTNWMELDRLVVRVTGKTSGSDAGTDTGSDTDGDTGDDGLATNAAELFEQGRVPHFELTLDQAAIALFSSTAEEDRKTWVRGTFKYGSTVINNVGVRRKGTSSFRVYPNKIALKIKFDKYVDDQKFLGLTDLTLNNMMGDPTFLAERLSYHVFRSAGLPAERANSARVSINGQYFGLYANVETPNDQFLARVFGAKANTLYEQAWGSEWLPGSEAGFEVEEGDETKADLTRLFQAVAAARSTSLLADVSPYLNTTRYLDFCAAEAAVGHYDGYAYGIWGSGNHFLAGDTEGVISLIPWSTDLTFSNREGVPDASNPLPAHPPAGSKTFLMRCKESSTCWSTYKTRVQAMLVKYESLGLLQLAKKWHAQIDPYVLADTKREASTWYYNSETNHLYSWIAARPSVVRGQLGLPTP